MVERCRFAPSTTGPAHPGTLLAGLLSWLDARKRGAEFLLRLEDLDPERCKPEWQSRMVEDLRWFGLDWDELQVQSERASVYEATLGCLEELGRLYPCSCSRTKIKAHGRRGPDGGWVYPNTCRARRLAGGWREGPGPLRARLDDGEIAVTDESGVDLSQRPSEALGDPVVVRRDGAVAYNLAVVADDNATGISRVVRGRDIAPSTATQVALQGLLSMPRPIYRHHLLFLENRGSKLAKLHGAVGAPELRRHYTSHALCGVIAHAAGLIDEPRSVAATELVAGFDWRRVRQADRVLHWDGQALRPGP
jgi:glutamyl-Q tRNA(Asp) synthetase